jgi:hypothetical protein
MQLSPTPDLGSNRRVLITAAIITVCVWAVMAWSQGDIAKTLGDTDDAMRLVLVRDLLSGRGWYDQLVTRLQPPVGAYMHWSRLLDGALAAMTWVFRLVVAPSSAELATRFAWPLLWIFPAVVCALTIVRSLGGRAAVFVGMVLMLVDVQLYAQFRPGRVDHHNVQITLTLIAAAFTLTGRGRVGWAVGAGVAAGLGLAIGIEALAFQALIGASYGARLVLDPDEARSARAYGLALAASTLVFFALQTPPWRWSMSFCDSLGWNLLIAIGVAGVGLAAVASWGAKLSAAQRFGLLVLVGAAATAAYLGADPRCLHGPFASVDPRLRPIWFDRVQELRSWPVLLRVDRDAAIVSMTMALMGLASAIYLLATRRRRLDPALWLACALMALAAFAASHALRMEDYAFWFGVPIVAAAFTDIAARRLRGLLLPTLVASLFLSPVCVALAMTAAVKLSARPTAKVAAKAKARTAAAADSCFDTRAYAPLETLPPGVVLADIDLGPFVLAHSANSVLSAPYHRMSWGIWAAHVALAAPPGAAERAARALKVRYVVDCPGSGSSQGPTSLEDNLRRGRVPPWLEPLSKPGDTLQIYQVKPAVSPQTP